MPGSEHRIIWIPDLRQDGQYPFAQLFLKQPFGGRSFIRQADYANIAQVWSSELINDGKLNRARFAFFLSCPDPEKKPHFCKAVCLKLALSYHTQTQPFYIFQLWRYFLF